MGIDFWTLLQLNDATFPIGSYTLSWGGETARLSYEAWKKGDYAALKRIDQIYEASKSAKEIREGSKKLAARFLKTVGSWGSLEAQDAEPICVRHFPLAYGAYCAKAGIQEEDALSAFLYSQASSRATTIVKLVPLSQTDGQKILRGLFDGFGRVLKKVMEMDESDLCRSCPAGDARAMQHEFLYTRLYMS